MRARAFAIARRRGYRFLVADITTHGFGTKPLDGVCGGVGSDKRANPIASRGELLDDVAPDQPGATGYQNVQLDEL